MLQQASLCIHGQRARCIQGPQLYLAAIAAPLDVKGLSVQQGPDAAELKRLYLLTRQFTVQ